MTSNFGEFLKTLRTRHPDGSPITWNQVTGQEPWPEHRRAEPFLSDRQHRVGPPIAAESVDLGEWRLDRFTSGEPPPQTFLLAPLFPLGTAGVLFGPGGVGKSMLALDLCISVARRAMMPAGGLNFAAGPLGCVVPPEGGGASIYISLEDSAAELHRRTVTLDPAGARSGAPVFVVPALELQGFDPTLVEERGRTGILTDFAEHGLTHILDSVADVCDYRPRLLVLDPAGDFLAGDENSAAIVKPLMRRLRAVAREYGVTVLLIGHVSKSLDAAATMRGSGAWIANSRFAYSLAPEGARKDAKALKDASAGAGMIWGELVKANHAGAPIGKRRPFQRDTATGRLVDASGLVTTKPSEADLAHALILACIEAAEAAKAFKMTGDCGLYARRAELPEALAGLSRQKLESLGRDLVEEGFLRKDHNANLMPPEE